MSKSVLVMDTPEKCEECNFSNPDGDWCPFHGVVTYTEYASCKPEDCPLKPMPEKMIYNVNMSLVSMGEMIGWNTCIDAICGEEKEDEKRDNQNK